MLILGVFVVVVAFTTNGVAMNAGTPQTDPAKTGTGSTSTATPAPTGFGGTATGSGGTATGSIPNEGRSQISSGRSQRTDRRDQVGGFLTDPYEAAVMLDYSLEHPELMLHAYGSDYGHQALPVSDHMLGSLGGPAPIVDPAPMIPVGDMYMDPLYDPLYDYGHTNGLIDHPAPTPTNPQSQTQTQSGTGGGQGSTSAQSTGRGANSVQDRLHAPPANTGVDPLLDSLLPPMSGEFPPLYNEAPSFDFWV